MRMCVYTVTQINLIKEKEKEVSFMEFLSYLISGISLGSVYAIIALGYSSRTWLS